MVTQLQHFEMARRRIAEFNSMFMDLVNHPTNPLTKSDLAALIAKRPNTYGRFAGFMDKLPDRQSHYNICERNNLMPRTVTLYRHYSGFTNRPDMYAFEDRDRDTDNGREYLLPDGWAEGGNEFRHGLIDPDGYVHDTIQADPDTGLPAIWYKALGRKPDVVLPRA